MGLLVALESLLIMGPLVVLLPSHSGLLMSLGHLEIIFSISGRCLQGLGIGDAVGVGGGWRGEVLSLTDGIPFSVLFQLFFLPCAFAAKVV